MSKWQGQMVLGLLAFIAGNGSDNSTIALMWGVCGLAFLIGAFFIRED